MGMDCDIQFVQRLAYYVCEINRVGLCTCWSLSIWFAWVSGIICSIAEGGLKRITFSFWLSLQYFICRTESDPTERRQGGVEGTGEVIN